MGLDWSTINNLIQVPTFEEIYIQQPKPVKSKAKLGDKTGQKVEPRSRTKLEIYNELSDIPISPRTSEVEEISLDLTQPVNPVKPGETTIQKWSSESGSELSEDDPNLVRQTPRL